MPGIGSKGLEHACDQARLRQRGTREPSLNLNYFLGYLLCQHPVLLPQFAHRPAGYESGDVDREDIDILSHQLEHKLAC